jgi:hypothetical protein
LDLFSIAEIIDFAKEPKYNKLQLLPKVPRSEHFKRLPNVDFLISMYAHMAVNRKWKSKE